MNTHTLNFFKQARLFCLALTVGLVISTQVVGADGVPPLNIAKKPLNAIVTTSPNVLYILDDSGSMDWNYLPDWAGAGYCRTTGNPDDFSRSCKDDDNRAIPPARSSDFNSIYYNPAVTYTPPKNADGTSKPSQTSATWTAVKDDAYGIQSTNTTNLLTKYTDIEWCTSTAYTDCVRNDNYIMPTDVNVNWAPRLDGKQYNVAHAVFATGTGYVATGPRNAPTKALKEFGPHYYKINAGEYCDSAALTKCQETQDATYSYPAKLRWCANNTQATSPPATAGTVDGCRATRKTGFTQARYPTKYVKISTVNSYTKTNEVLYVAGTPASVTCTTPPCTAGSAAVAAQVATGASVSFSFILGGDCEGSDKARIKKVLVNGVNLLNDRTSKTLSASTLAGYVRDEINATPAPRPYVVSGSGNNVKLQAPATDGAITYPVSIQLESGSCSVTLSPTTPKFAGYTAATAYQAAVPASPGYVATSGTSATCGSPVTLVANSSGFYGTNSWSFTAGQKVCQTFSNAPTTATTFYGSFSRVDIVLSTPNYPKAPTRSDCVDDVIGNTCTYDEEMTNFANWWTYYHTRMQSMKTSTSRAFDAIDNRTRVGFSTISDTTATNGTTYLDLGNFDAGQKNTWYNRLFNTAPSGNTPLREALSQAGRVYANKIGNDPVQYSCQQNFALLTTDGYWNGSNSGGKAGLDVNGTLIGNLDSGAAIPRPKREDVIADGGLADVAKYFYDTDLRTLALGNCTGALGAGINVCEDGTSSVMQRMATYTLGLGVDGSLSYSKTYKTDTVGDYKDLTTGTKNWPSPFNGSDEKIDDLWHAAVNGEGLYFSAKDPQDVTQGLADALADIGASKGSASPSGISSRQPALGNNFAYRATFISDKWTGNVEKRTIDPASGALSNTIVNCVEDIAADPPLSACTGINTSSPVLPSARKIYINSGGGLANFTYANLPGSTVPVMGEPKYYFTEAFLGTKVSHWGTLTAAQKTVAVEDGLVNFLRGDTSLEDRSSNLSGTTDNRIYRYRQARLGDVAESQPVYVGQPSMDYGDGYPAFKAVSRPATVYVGANDGMLHAFDAVTLQERWAFVPTAVMPKLWSLADRNYSHENFVNGTVVVADAKINGNWETILIGGLNGGGRSYYALKVTNPNAPELLWEFTDNNMGYTFGKPKVVKNKVGDWLVLLTSGYNNRPDFLKPTGDGGGYLYTVDLNLAPVGNINAGSAGVKVYATGEGTTAFPSGLAKISAFAYEPRINNTAIFVYGGDLAGNLWRFDINDPPAPGPNPLLFAVLTDTGGNKQPISTEPELAYYKNKRMVYVGTGRFLEPDDRDTVQVQTVYGIQDDDVTTTLVNRAGLTEQKLSGTGSTRTSTQIGATGARGWYADLSVPGERQSVDSQLYSGNLIVTTNVPTGTDCTPNGFSWLNVFDYRTGAVVVSVQLNYGITGGNLYQKSNGDVNIKNDTASGKGLIGTVGDYGPILPIESLTFQDKRTIWRELTK
ncbi:MAG: hypothetical protein HOP26_05225 [Methylotenera sp.]|nr:hypothetical protein [Methylotenera sp.]